MATRREGYSFTKHKSGDEETKDDHVSSDVFYMNDCTCKCGARLGCHLCEVDVQPHTPCSIEATDRSRVQQVTTKA